MSRMNCHTFSTGFGGFATLLDVRVRVLQICRLFRGVGQAPDLGEGSACGAGVGVPEGADTGDADAGAVASGTDQVDAYAGQLGQQALLARIIERGVDGVVAGRQAG